MNPVTTLILTRLGLASLWQVLHVGLPTLAFSPLVRALRSTQLKLLLPKVVIRSSSCWLTHSFAP